MLETRTLWLISLDAETGQVDVERLPLSWHDREPYSFVEFERRVPLDSFRVVVRTTVSEEHGRSLAAAMLETMNRFGAKA